MNKCVNVLVCVLMVLIFIIKSWTYDIVEKSATVYKNMYVYRTLKNQLKINFNNRKENFLRQIQFSSKNSKGKLKVFLILLPTVCTCISYSLANMQKTLFFLLFFILFKFYFFLSIFLYFFPSSSTTSFPFRCLKYLIRMNIKLNCKCE